MATAPWLQGVLGGDGAARNYEPQRMNSGLLFIDDVGSNQGEQLRLALASFPLPKIQTAQSVIPFLNEDRKYAGRTVYEDMTCSFHDYVDRGTLNILLGWKQRVYDPLTGTKGFKADYAKDGWIEVYPPGVDGHGHDKATKYRIYGIWPMLLDCGDIDMGSDEPVRINCQFSVDKIIPAAITPVKGTPGTVTNAVQGWLGKTLSA